MIVARWVDGEAADVAKFLERQKSNCAKDRDGHLVFLPESLWRLNRAQEEWTGLKFTAVRERG